MPESTADSACRPPSITSRSRPGTSLRCFRSARSSSPRAKVTEVVDHDWAKSIYFRDPNGMSLEYCCYTRELGEDDAQMQPRFDASIRSMGLDPDKGVDIKPKK